MNIERLEAKKAQLDAQAKIDSFAVPAAWLVLLLTLMLVLLAVSPALRHSVGVN